MHARTHACPNNALSLRAHAQFGSLPPVDRTGTACRMGARSSAAALSDRYVVRATTTVLPTGV